MEQREIKLRAYHDGEMQYSETMGWGYWGDNIMSYADADSGKGWVVMESMHIKYPCGVDVFESDLFMHNKNLYKVVFSENLHRFIARNVIQEKGKPIQWRGLDWVKNVSKYIVYKGNIHQNPELIK